MCERVTLTIGTDDQAVELELTQVVDSVMSVMRPWTEDMSTMFRDRVKEGAIMKAIEVVIQDRRGRGEVITPWYVRRTLSAPSAAGVTFSC